METVGQSGEIHQRFERLGNFLAESRQAAVSRLTSMETGLATTLTGNLCWWLPITQPQPQPDDWTTCAQQWGERNHGHEQVVERSLINALQS